MSATPLAVQSFYNQNKFSTPNSSHLSPLHSDTAGKSPTAAPYLPGFLLGNSPSAVPSYGRSLSTQPYQNSSPSKINSKSPPNRSAGFPYTSPIERRQQQQRISPTNTSINIKDKGGAPPTESLYSSFPSNSFHEMDALKRSIAANTTSQHNDSVNTVSQSSFNNSVFSPQADILPQSPAQIDPFYSQGESITSCDVLDDTAVTVFGFPPAASSFILQQFAQYGTVEKHQVHNAGNWLHIKYQTKIQAKKALSKNGKIFARSIMIGVCPCIKKEIAAMEADLNTSSNIGSSSSSSSCNIGTPQVINTRKSTTMRPLSNTSSLTRSTSSGMSEPVGETPKKSDSVVGKALDYVFGW